MNTVLPPNGTNPLLACPCSRDRNQIRYSRQLRRLNQWLRRLTRWTAPWTMSARADRKVESMRRSRPGAVRLSASMMPTTSFVQAPDRLVHDLLGLVPARNDQAEGELRLAAHTLLNGLEGRRRPPGMEHPPQRQPRHCSEDECDEHDEQADGNRHDVPPG